MSAEQQGLLQLIDMMGRKGGAAVQQNYPPQVLPSGAHVPEFLRQGSALPADPYQNMPAAGPQGQPTQGGGGMMEHIMQIIEMMKKKKLMEEQAKGRAAADARTAQGASVYGDDTVVYPGHGDDTTIGEERPRLAEWRERGW